MLFVVLDILAVDPEHQSAGAGTKLIGWGLERADEMGAEVSSDESSTLTARILKGVHFRYSSRVQGVQRTCTKKTGFVRKRKSR